MVSVVVDSFFQESRGDLHRFCIGQGWSQRKHDSDFNSGQRKRDWKYKRQGRLQHGWAGKFFASEFGIFCFGGALAQEIRVAVTSSNLLPVPNVKALNNMSIQGTTCRGDFGVQIP